MLDCICKNSLFIVVVFSIYTMSGKPEDDFWNTTISSGFNFDDEEDLGFTPSYADVFKSTTEDVSVLPIHSIISKNCLDLVLDDIKSTIKNIVPPVEETIKKMQNGQKYVLEVYRRFSEKLMLLDAALETCDGNIIINVILFLKRTVWANIFYLQMSKRKMAIKHYATHLTINNQFDELAKLYMSTGCVTNMKLLCYINGKYINNKNILHKRLEQCISEYSHKLNNDEKSELQEYYKFLHWQIEYQQSSKSVINQLAILCKTEWENSKNPQEQIIMFKKQFNIDDFSYEWTIMNVMASMEMWTQLYELFVKPVEIFIMGLSRHKPPMDILEQYLVYMNDADRSLYLAHKLNCHKFIIQSYISQRNRLALTTYKSKVPIESAEYNLIVSTLQVSDKKWKN